MGDLAAAGARLRAADRIDAPQGGARDGDADTTIMFHTTEYLPDGARFIQTTRARLSAI